MDSKVIAYDRLVRKFVSDSNKQTLEKVYSRILIDLATAREDHRFIDEELDIFTKYVRVYHSEEMILELKDVLTRVDKILNERKNTQ